MKILVTGGTGYIGAYVSMLLLKKGHKVDIVDDLSNSKKSVINEIEKISKKKINKFYNCKIRELNIEESYDVVYHFAGSKSVEESNNDPLKYYSNNISETLILLEKMNKAKINKIVFSSSATVYGLANVPYKENMVCGIGLKNTYGRTKYMIEEILKDCSKAYNIDVAILRYFNPIGAHKSGLLGDNPTNNSNNIIPSLKKYKDNFIIFGDDYNTRDGTCIRDYIHIDDLAKGHLNVLNNFKKGVNIYNLGTGSGTSVKELLNIYQKVSKSKLNIIIGKRRSGDLPILLSDIEKAKKELKWKPKKSVYDAIKDAFKII